eukprot:TRINITY_DN18903_c0_g1_i1.p1 TRINITY_DN18903_c0_g1~~TRINITY_DN18903_c0_g1_i1.p1  ORF type:complete len:451 (+),score=69.40 TRINITY_DN18903_c0_g1_i1:128-1480(+)
MVVHPSADQSLRLDWLCVYIGSSVCLIGLLLTRQAYKLSEGFRARVAATGIHNVPDDAPSSKKASAVLAVFCDAWPASVSELLQDTEAAHGMVFRSLMVGGSLIITQADIGALSPVAPEMSRVAMYTINVVHLLRRLVFAAAIGFCFAPSTGRDFCISEVRETTTKTADGKAVRSARLSNVPWLRDANVKAISPEMRATLARTTIVGIVHSLLALVMLNALPALEFISLFWDIWVFSSLYVSRALAADACTIAYFFVALLRLLHIGMIYIGMGVFEYHFLSGFLSPSRHHTFKGFWGEFCACRSFAQLMMLAAVQSWFASPEMFDTLPSAMRVISFIAAAFHYACFFRFCARNAMLCFRNVEYSEADLANIFSNWRSQEAVVQTFLDAQLAFVDRVQQELENNQYADAPSRPCLSRMLFQQLQILLRCNRRAGYEPSKPPKPSGATLHED